LRQRSEHLKNENRQFSIDLQQNVLTRVDSFLFNSRLFEKNYSKIKEAFVSDPILLYFKKAISIYQKLFYFQSDLRKDSLMIENLLNDVRNKVKEASSFLVLSEEIGEEGAHLDEQPQEQQKHQESAHGSRPSSFNADFNSASINQRSNTNESQTTLIRHKF
jgi:hypothetical protein